jgi:hypothetical protein
MVGGEGGGIIDQFSLEMSGLLNSQFALNNNHSQIVYKNFVHKVVQWQTILLCQGILY